MNITFKEQELQLEQNMANSQENAVTMIALVTAGDCGS